jgi:hypothetical protein
MNDATIRHSGAVTTKAALFQHSASAAPAKKPRSITTALLVGQSGSLLDFDSYAKGFRPHLAGVSPAPSCLSATMVSGGRD